MSKLALFTDKECYEVATSIVANVLDAGFELELIRVYENSCRNDGYMLDLMQEIDGAIAVFSGRSNEISIWISYLIGANKKVWVVNDSIPELPAVLRTGLCIPLSEKYLESRILDEIKSCYNVEEIPLIAHNDFMSLVGWLSERPNRFSKLSARDFEYFVLNLFLSLFGEKNMRYLQKNHEFLFQSPVNTNILVSCKNYISGAKIGIGTVEQIVSNAASYSCTSSFVFTTNKVTPSALEYAKTCYPPIRFVGREKLIELVTNFIRSDFKQKKSYLLKVLGWSGLGKSSLAAIDNDNHRKNTKLKFEITKHYNNIHDRFIENEEGDELGKMIEEMIGLNRGQNKNIFISFPHGHETDKFNEIAEKLIDSLEENDLRVWHDYPGLNKGIECKYLQDVSKVVKDCSVILCLFNVDISQVHSHGNILEGIASALNQCNNPNKPPVIFFGEDNVWNRFCLPSFYEQSHILSLKETFGDESDKNKIEKTLNGLHINTAHRRLKEMLTKIILTKNI